MVLSCMKDATHLYNGAEHSLPLGPLANPIRQLAEALYSS